MECVRLIAPQQNIWNLQKNSGMGIANFCGIFSRVKGQCAVE